MRAMRGLILAVAVAAIAAALAAALAPPAYAFECDGIALSDGCLFTITGGDTPNPDDGFAVTNADGVPLWEFVREQDLQAVGYPISQRWRVGPFTFQAFQKVILQWDPGKERMNWYNTLDALANQHPGVELPNVPPHQVLEADQGVTDFGTIARNHLALLDANPKIKTAFLAQPNWLNLYGLPIRYEEREIDGNPQGLQVLRAQRTVFAIWNVPAPGTSLGVVVVQNVPDKIKRLSNIIIPDEVKFPSRQRNLDQYYLAAMDGIRHHSELHGTDTFDWLSQQAWFADGLDEKEKALIVALRSFIPKDLDRLEHFIDTYNVSTSSITLPMSGTVNVWIYSYSSFNYGNDLAQMVKQAVSSAEKFLKHPFPTTDVIVSVVEQDHRSYHGTAFFGSYVLFKVFDNFYPEMFPEIFRGAMYHETSHYIFGGHLGSGWIVEGGANHLTSYVWRELGEENFEDQTVRLRESVERDCVEGIGVNTLQELNDLARDYEGIILCNYSFGELLLHSLFGILGPEAMGSALREITLLRLTKDRPLFDSEIYQVILGHTPAIEESDVRELFRRLHGGAFTRETEAEIAEAPVSDSVRADIAELLPWAENPPDAVHRQALGAVAALWEIDSGLARRITGFEWVVDGMIAQEALSLVDIARIAEVHVSIAGQMLQFPWVDDDIKAWEQKAIEDLRRLAESEHELGTIVVGLPWVVDDLTPQERVALRALAGIGERDRSSVRRLLALPWLVDGLELDERNVLVYIGQIAAADAELGKSIMGLGWVSDGWSDREVHTLRHLADISRVNRDVGRHLARLPWLAAEISDEEARTIHSLRDIAVQDVESAVRLVGYAWFNDDIVPLEEWATRSLRRLNDIDRDMARRVLDYTWFIDDISDVEAWAVHFLWRIALKDPVSAREILSYSWIVDGIVYSEYEQLASWVDGLENS